MCFGHNSAAYGSLSLLQVQTAIPVLGAAICLLFKYIKSPLYTVPQKSVPLFLVPTRIRPKNFIKIYTHTLA